MGDTATLNSPLVVRGNIGNVYLLCGSAVKELGGWENYATVAGYAKANAGERAIKAHKKLSPGDRLNTR